MSPAFAESIGEVAAYAWLVAIGLGVLYGPDLAVGVLAPERTCTSSPGVVLVGPGSIQVENVACP